MFAYADTPLSKQDFRMCRNQQMKWCSARLAYAALHLPVYICQLTLRQLF